MLAFLLSAAFLVPQAQEPIPTARDYTQWLAKIEPDATELAYLEVGWRNKFWPAVEEARALGRPLLLWTMNGHPLGCT